MEEIWKDIPGYKNNFQTNHFNLGKKGKENSKSIEVFQFSLDGTFVNSFVGLSEAGRFTDINQGSISKCCHGKYKTSGGFIWKFKDKSNDLSQSHESDECLMRLLVC